MSVGWQGSDDVIKLMEWCMNAMTNQSGWQHSFNTANRASNIATPIPKL
ncbi:hypothetical protein [Tateyamaria sp.]